MVMNDAVLLLDEYVIVFVSACEPECGPAELLSVCLSYRNFRFHELKLAFLFCVFAPVSNLVSGYKHVLLTRIDQRNTLSVMQVDATLFKSMVVLS